MAVNQNLVPIVIEKSGRTERAYDIYSRLLKDRIVFLGGPLDDTTANLLIAQMLFLSNEDNKTDIHFYVNSPGGSITAGLAVYDTMRFLRTIDGRKEWKAICLVEQQNPFAPAADCRDTDRTGDRFGHRSARDTSVARPALRDIGQPYRADP
jgi:hypothetical protein